VAFLAAGEGWHNYHHAFPWDYRAAELGSPLNATCAIIDFLAKYGIIYDRREATANMVGAAFNFPLNTLLMHARSLG
jgi:stearoyl-CoA desaturase (delta-9 desaturase)